MRVEPLQAAAAVEAEFVAVGHVTVDRFADGSCAAGGSALYSALFAARCGVEAAVVTAGDPAALDELLAPFEDDVRVHVQPGAELTALVTEGAGIVRSQRVAARAPNVARVPVSAQVVHLGPVLRELRGDWAAERVAPLVGLTPQGLLRTWDADGVVTLFEPERIDPFVADVVVLSEAEERCAGGLLGALDPDALVVVTREERPALVRSGRSAREVPGFAVEPRSDLGAGDVFAAALLLARAEGRPVEEAVRFAHAAGAAKVASPGDARSVPGREAVERMLAGG